MLANAIMIERTPNW